MTNKTPISNHAEAENEKWKKFKSDSDEIINQSENKINTFKKQSGKISNRLKSGFNKKVTQLEQKNAALKKKMKDFVKDRTDRQEKFTKEFNQSVKDIL